MEDVLQAQNLGLSFGDAFAAPSHQACIQQVQLSCVTGEPAMLISITQTQPGLGSAKHKHLLNLSPVQLKLAP